MKKLLCILARSFVVFRQEQITPVIEERTFIEVHLVTTGEETKAILIRFSAGNSP